MLDPSAIELPQIPGKRYFTIGEVSALCDVKPHVLRYWEQEFPQLQPVKRRGNRRYYQRHEVEMIREIRKLLYLDGYTISGARIQLQKPISELQINSGTQVNRESYREIIDELEKISLLLEVG
jgi:DNA-binding transcriptional MerR regulator